MGTVSDIVVVHAVLLYKRRRRSSRGRQQRVIRLVPGCRIQSNFKDVIVEFYCEGLF